MNELLELFSKMEKSYLEGEVTEDMKKGFVDKFYGFWPTAIWELSKLWNYVNFLALGGEMAT